MKRTINGAIFGPPWGLHYDCSILWQNAVAADDDDDDSFSVEIHLKATERHLPYGITQRYLPPDTGGFALPQPQPNRLVLDLPT